MRRRAAATLVAVVVAAGLTACGNEGGSGARTDAGGRPLLPAPASGAGASAATAEVASGDARTLIERAPVEYRVAEGAEAPATRGPAYRFVPEGESAEAKLSKVLGAGTLEVRHGAWSFQTTNQSLVVRTSECRVLPDGSCEEKPLPPPPPDVPSASEAAAEAKEVLERLGVDPSSGRITALDVGEPVYQRTVAFEPEVGGLAVQDLATTISFGENGRIEFATGHLGTFEKVGDYPLAALAEALDRFSPGMVGGEAQVAIGGSEPASPGSGDGEPSDPAPEPPAPVEPRLIEITGADLVLMPVHPRCEGGELFLVPAFRLQPEEVGFAVPAAAPESIAEPADTEPRAEPCPGQAQPDAPIGRPEPAPMPPDAGREPAAP